MSGYLISAIIYFVGSVLFHIEGRLYDDRGRTDDRKPDADGGYQCNDELLFNDGKLAGIGYLASAILFYAALLSLAMCAYEM